MTLPKNLTIITSFLFTSKKVDIFLQKTYIFWQICVLLNAKPERDTNVLNIRHSEVSSLFPQVSWSKISYVSKNKRVAKHCIFWYMLSSFSESSRIRYFCFLSFPLKVILQTNNLFFPSLSCQRKIFLQMVMKLVAGHC